jgi:cyclic pyranopterin phosphate synthase
MAIRSLHDILQFTTIRFTGGEPLLHAGLVPLMTSLRAGMPTTRFALTTNGYLLARRAKALAAAGLTDVNVSLDAVDSGSFYRVTGQKDPGRVLAGIAAARDAGMDVKINSVIIRGVNEQEILPLLRFGQGCHVPVRFLELMKMGHLHHGYRDHFFGMNDIIAAIRSAGIGFRAVGRAPHGTACYWRLTDGYYFGIIANETVPFCRDCDRLRLDSGGNIYGCLSSDTPLAIFPYLGDREQLESRLREALSHKKTAFTGSTISMMDIGG